jgi:hypothetical protein
LPNIHDLLSTIFPRQFKQDFPAFKARLPRPKPLRALRHDQLEGARKPTKVQKYFDDWPVFYSILYRPGEADAMWLRLSRLITDRRYAESYLAAHPAPSESGAEARSARTCFGVFARAR